MGYKAAIQVLKQAEDFKPKVLQQSDLLNDAQAWTNQQKLLSIYHQVLVLDLEYALDKKVEQDLWNIGFKTYITNLQNKARDKKNLQRSETQALLTWALEAASGFYLTLLQELCNIFDIDLPFRRRGIIYGQTTICDPVNMPQLASCSYICQYCLVHLGDIARYRNQRKQAETFYRQAILVSPNSGHPYNQLALLEASQGDKLSTVFYHIRGICVKNPFPASTANLMNVLSNAIDKESHLENIQTKMTVNEYIRLFLSAHGHFHIVTDLKQAQLQVQSLNSVMTALVATQSFKKQQLIKITIINLYALTHLGRDLTNDELKVKDLILELIAGSLSAFLMPVYTLQNDEGLTNYYALPAVKLLMYFLKNNVNVLKCKVFRERMQIWPSLCKLVNAAQGLLIGFNYNKFSKCSLHEDRYLQGFLPLEQNLKEFNFEVEIEDDEVESIVRMRRIIDFAKWLCDYDLDGTKLIIKSETKGFINFEAVLSQPDPTRDLLEEMKSFNIKEIRENTINNEFPEKKAGILKPQGSLEKSREEREVKKTVEENTSEIAQKNAESTRTKRPKQNAILQSIFKKMEESKQVKFNVAEEATQEPIKVADANPPNQFTNPPQLRTQSFNQNHPAFPLQPPQSNDYLTNLRNLSKGADNMMPQFSKNFSNLPNNQPAFNQYSVPPPQFNSWGREDLKLPPATNQNTWWPQNQPYNPQTYTYPNQYNQNYPQQFYQKPPNFDTFSSPWPIMNDNSMSMRQAMLKEATTSQEYSLFNNTSWNPSLQSQPRQVEKVFNGPQHSLFGGPGPQSLAQLLEHQQNQIGPNFRPDT
ncbi:unnamed protein product [Ceutorhynchus assimilis]|uniref:Protein SMG7 n=1 Tax=Ceutorhynchus assimilis TaxID=467358 RepID=A0A9N9QSV5_9CUCU|nr:unnamed protein product [Ceutorhynchus assimilis]